MNTNRINATFANKMNNMSSLNRILILIMTAVLFFILFYWSFHVNKNHLANSRYQTLVAPFIEIEKNMQPISQFVHGSASGHDISLSFWLKVKQFKTSRHNAANPINFLFGLSNSAYVGIDKQTNNLVVFVRGESGNTIVELENIPFYTWSHFIVSISRQSVTIYQNGQIIKTELLASAPLMSHTYNVYTNESGNQPYFEADIGNLYYIGKTLHKSEIDMLSQQIPKIPKH